MEIHIDFQNSKTKSFTKLISGKQTYNQSDYEFTLTADWDESYGWDLKTIEWLNKVPIEGRSYDLSVNEFENHPLTILEKQILLSFYEQIKLSS